MKNIAIPVKEQNARQFRARERSRLQQTDVITEAEKDRRLRKVDAEIGKINKRYAADLGSAKADESLTDEQREVRLNEIYAQEQQETGIQRGRRAQILAALTEEARAQRLQELDAEDAAFEQSYGLQPMSNEESAQQNADRLAHADYLTNEKYKDDRRVEYPSIGDQLDAVWKIVNALIAGTAAPADAIAVHDAIATVKNKYPTPKKN